MVCFRSLNQKIIVLFAAAVMMTAGCSYVTGNFPGNDHSTEEGLGDEIISFEQVQAEVFNISCQTCHLHAGQFTFEDITVVDRFREQIAQRVFVTADMPMGSSLSGRQRSLLKMWLEQKEMP